MSSVRAIEQKLGEALGLRPRRGAGANLERELERVRVEYGFDLDDVARRLEKEPWLVRRLAGAITVEETFFLRHPEHFEHLVAHVRTRLSRAPHEKVVLWSAGCASGEEPYSMAIAIHRALGPEALARVRILANDVDENSLEKARRGIYGRWSFRGTDPGVVARYFEPIGREEHRVVAPIREAVGFEHLSLVDQLDRLGSSTVDVVFFRNVAIYLTAEALAHVYRGLERVLREGAMMVLGPADPLPISDELARLRIERGFVHEKRGVRPLASTKTTTPASPASRKAILPPVPPPITERAPRRPPPAEEPMERPTTGTFTRLSSILDVARQLANRGHTDEALAILEHELSLTGGRSDVLSLRGRIHLSRGSLERAIEDFRAALFVSPEDALSRFHYAAALAAAHRSRPARLQLLSVLRELEGADDDEVLADGETTVASLRRSVAERLRHIE